MLFPLDDYWRRRWKRFSFDFLLEFMLKMAMNLFKKKVTPSFESERERGKIDFSWKAPKIGNLNHGLGQPQPSLNNVRLFFYEEL